MPTTEAPHTPPPAQDPDPNFGLPPERRSSSNYGDLGTDDLVQRINELEDERRAARIREGIWVSLLLHAAFFLLWAYGPRYILHEPRIVNPADVIRNRKDLAYLDLPPDALKQLKPRNPATLSDKNRQQSSPHPTLDKKTLQQLQAMKKAGPPRPETPPKEQAQQAPPAPQPQQAPPAPQAPQQQQAQQAPQQPSPLQPEQPQPPRQQAQESQQPTNPFKTPSSAGDMIRQATRGAASPSSGDYGQNAPSNHGGLQAGVDILSDTMGVDFGPYMKRVIQATYTAWLPIIPESAKPPLNNKGKVGIEFIIAPDGSVKKMVLKYPSGDVALDRAAWGGITGASYPPLPKEFKGPYLALRFGFYYNIHPEDDK